MSKQAAFRKIFKSKPNPFTTGVAPTTVVARNTKRFFPDFTVKKNAFVEANEVLRENQFETFRITPKALFGGMVMLVLIPGTFYNILVGEQRSIEDRDGRKRAEFF